MADSWVKREARPDMWGGATTLVIASLAVLAVGLAFGNSRAICQAGTATIEPAAPGPSASPAS